LIGRPHPTLTAVITDQDNTATDARDSIVRTADDHDPLRSHPLNANERAVQTAFACFPTYTAVLGSLDRASITTDDADSIAVKGDRSKRCVLTQGQGIRVRGKLRWKHRCLRAKSPSRKGDQPTDQDASIEPSHWDPHVIQPRTITVATNKANQPRNRFATT
jgi:hypothetical protein